MTEEKKGREQKSKEEKRLMAEQATKFAAEDNKQRKLARDDKTAKLRALRLAKELERKPQ